MKLIIDIDDNLYTRLFDNGDEYVADMRRACVAIRKSIPLLKYMDELKRRLFMEVDGGTDDMYLRYTDVCDRISNTIETYIKAERSDKE